MRTINERTVLRPSPLSLVERPHFLVRGKPQPKSLAVLLQNGRFFHLLPLLSGQPVVGNDDGFRSAGASSLDTVHGELKDEIKRRLFVATVESVLLYGAETWTLTAQQEKALDGIYTRMLRIALNVSWNDYVRNVNLYGGLPRVSAKVRERRM